MFVFCLWKAVHLQNSPGGSPTNFYLPYWGDKYRVFVIVRDDSEHHGTFSKRWLPSCAAAGQERGCHASFKSATSSSSSVRNCSSNSLQSHVTLGPRPTKVKFSSQHRLDFRNTRVNCRNRRSITRWGSEPHLNRNVRKTEVSKLSTKKIYSSLVFQFFPRQGLLQARWGSLPHENPHLWAENPHLRFEALSRIVRKSSLSKSLRSHAPLQPGTETFPKQGSRVICKANVCNRILILQIFLNLQDLQTLALLQPQHVQMCTLFWNKSSKCSDEWAILQWAISCAAEFLRKLNDWATVSKDKYYDNVSGFNELLHCPDIVFKRPFRAQEWYQRSDRLHGTATSSAFLEEVNEF